MSGSSLFFFFCRSNPSPPPCQKTPKNTYLTVSPYHSSSTTRTRTKNVFLLTRFLLLSGQWQNFSYVGGRVKEVTTGSDNNQPTLPVLEGSNSWVGISKVVSYAGKWEKQFRTGGNLKDVRTCSSQNSAVSRQAGEFWELKTTSLESCQDWTRWFRRRRQTSSVLIWSALVWSQERLQQ